MVVEVLVLVVARVLSCPSDRIPPLRYQYVKAHFAPLKASRLTRVLVLVVVV